MKKEGMTEETPNISSYSYAEANIYELLVGTEVVWSACLFDSFIGDWKFLIILAVLLNICPNVCVSCPDN